MLDNSLSPARIVSLCVSKPKSVMYQGHELRTGIFKEPVPGKVALRRLNLDGDEQADLTVHGGVVRHCMCMLLSTIRFGEMNCLIPNLSGVLLARISPPRDCWKARFVLVMNFKLVRRLFA